MSKDEVTRPSKKSRLSRWGNATSQSNTSDLHKNDDEKSNSNARNSVSTKKNTSNLAQSIANRLAAVKQKKLADKRRLASQPSGSSISDSATLKTDQDGSGKIVKKAKVYDLDMSVTSRPTFREGETQGSKIAGSLPDKPLFRAKKAANPYLAHLTKKKQTDDDKEDKAKGSEDVIEILDSRLAGGHVQKMRTRNKPLAFIEPGTYVEIAEKKRKKAMNAMKSGFLSGRKEGNLLKSTGIAASISQTDGENDDISVLPPRADCICEEMVKESSRFKSVSSYSYNIPLIMEWWDIELLPQKLKKEVASIEQKYMADRTRKRMDVSSSSSKSNSLDNDTMKEKELQSKCFSAASISHSKTSSLIQHPGFVIPPNALQNLKNEASKSSSTQTLHLTKKEMKRQRKLKRAEKLRIQQDLQAAGLVPPPEPKLTLSNFLRVLGDQAVMDPSKMEEITREQIKAREKKHIEHNQSNKLTREQLREKRRRKMHEDTTLSVEVALFLVKDMSHPYHRAKVDLNAQQLKITGGVLECLGEPQLALVIAEGGPKAIKKYTRLMTVRMKWKGEDLIGLDDDSDEEGEVRQNVEMENAEMSGESDQKEDTNGNTKVSYFNISTI